MKDFKSTNSAGSILDRAKALFPEIRAAADEIEAGRTLPLEIVEAMRRAGVFSITAPKDWGGPELSPAEQFEVIEAIARADGSAGWCAYIGSSWGFFSSFVDDATARSIFKIDSIGGGAAIPPGQGIEVDGGYIVTGRWAFGSGCAHADWFFCSFIVPGTGDTPPRFLSGFIPRSQYEVMNNWNATGLRGSGSHDYSVKDLFIPKERTFDLAKSPARRRGAIYAFPMLLVFGHAAVIAGIARAALDEFRQLALTKTNQWGPLHTQAYARTAVAQAEGILRAARALCLETARDIYDTLLREQDLSQEQLAMYRVTITHAHKAATKAVDLIFDAAGTSSIRVPSVLDRCFRDAHTANQHLIASLKTYEMTGAMLLGQDPGDPMFTTGIRVAY